MPGATFLPFI